MTVLRQVKMITANNHHQNMPNYQEGDIFEGPLESIIVDLGKLLELLKSS